MKILIKVMVAAVVLFSLRMYMLGRSEHRTRFTFRKVELYEAHRELHEFGKFTNQFREAQIYPYTNRFTSGGVNYQCEFAAECEDFRGRGRLTITTDEIFVWIDEKGGIIPLTGERHFPPGF